MRTIDNVVALACPRAVHLADARCVLWRLIDVYHVITEATGQRRQYAHHELLCPRIVWEIASVNQVRTVPGIGQNRRGPTHTTQRGSAVPRSRQCRLVFLLTRGNSSRPCRVEIE